MCLYENEEEFSILACWEEVLKLVLVSLTERRRKGQQLKLWFYEKLIPSILPKATSHKHNLHLLQQSDRACTNPNSLLRSLLIQFTHPQVVCPQEISQLQKSDARSLLGHFPRIILTSPTIDSQTLPLIDHHPPYPTPLNASIKHPTSPLISSIVLPLYVSRPPSPSPSSFP